MKDIINNLSVLNKNKAKISSCKMNNKNEGNNWYFQIKQVKKIDELVERYTSSRSSKNVSSQKNLKIHADCRIFEEKISELKDATLVNFLLKKINNKRRNATCRGIDKDENQSKLLNYIQFLLCEQYLNGYYLI